MKCSTREMAIERYGHIDLVNKVWPHQDIWMKSLAIPGDWFSNWKVLDTGHLVNHLYCNIDMHAPLSNALKQIKDKGLATALHTYDGCFNIRAVRGSNLVSAHAYGLAIDINAKEEPLGSLKRLPEGVVAAFRSQGFAYGGDFHGRKDGMHFSYCWE